MPWPATSHHEERARDLSNALELIEAPARQAATLRVVEHRPWPLFSLAGEHPGIWLFSLDASSRLAVEAGRRLYQNPLRISRSCE